MSNYRKTSPTTVIVKENAKTKAYLANVLDEASEAAPGTSLEEASLLIKKGAIVVDVRGMAEQNGWRKIDSAVSVPRGEIEMFAVPGAEKYHKCFDNVEDQYLLCCSSGFRAKLAGLTLSKLGFKNVRSFALKQFASPEELQTWAQSIGTCQKRTQKTAVAESDRRQELMEQLVKEASHIHHVRNGDFVIKLASHQKSHPRCP